MSESSVPNIKMPDILIGSVAVIGVPNAGKSSLLNAVLGTKLSIVSRKAQTTRHRIMGIVNQPDWQIVYSDTPGVLDPAYKLQEAASRAFVEKNSGL